MAASPAPSDFFDEEKEPSEAGSSLHLPPAVSRHRLPPEAIPVRLRPQFPRMNASSPGPAAMCKKKARSSGGARDGRDARDAGPAQAGLQRPGPPGASKGLQASGALGEPGASRGLQGHPPPPKTVQEVPRCEAWAAGFRVCTL